jgi:predicted transcriptional regulator
VARTTVKATYSLDEETIRTLEGLARRLSISKSEVMRRAIHHLARSDLVPGDAEIAALDELQRTLALTPREAEEWETRVRSERLASGPRS